MMRKINNKVYQSLKSENLKHIYGGLTERTADPCTTWTQPTKEFPCGDWVTIISYDGTASHWKPSIEIFADDCEIL